MTGVQTCALPIYTSVFEVDVVNCLAADAANRLISQTSLARPPFALEFEVT